MNIILTLILISNLALLGLLLVFALKVRKAYDDFKAFITPADEKTPSQLALLCVNLADMLAGALMDKLKASIMGLQSGAVRAENAEQADLVGSMVSQANPLLGMLLQIIPKAWQRKMVKHPELVDLALSKLGNKSATVVEAGNNGHSQIKFKL